MKDKDKIKTLFSDQYPGINLVKFKQYLKQNKIKLVFTAGDCAFSNGLNERANQTLVNRMRFKIYEKGNRPWCVIAQECVDDYNNTIHSSTGFSPAYLMTGKDQSFLPNQLNPNTMGNLNENRLAAFKNSENIHSRIKTITIQIQLIKHSKKETWFTLKTVVDSIEKN